MSTLELSHLKTLDLVAASQAEAVVLSGSARDFFLTEMWGQPPLGAEDRRRLHGVYPQPGWDATTVLGCAFSRWWMLVGD